MNIGLILSQCHGYLKMFDLLKSSSNFQCLDHILVSFLSFSKKKLKMKLLMRQTIFYYFDLFRSAQKVTKNSEKCLKNKYFTSEEEKIYPISSDTMRIWIDIEPSYLRYP